jgi:ribosomal protein L16 Arg81 hydroxylase
MTNRAAYEGFDLAKVLHPITVEEFYADYYEKKPLHIRRNDPQYFEPLLTLEEIDRVITTLGLSHPAIECVNALKPLTTGEYTFPSGMIDVTRLYQHFANGATIILPALHDRVAPLAHLCRAMEAQMSARFQTNIYLTPGGEMQGFRTHFDSHDVFVLQVSGSKRWQIFDTAVELPYRGMRFDPTATQPKEMTAEFDLLPGDTYYLPRGIMHHAITQAGGSLHATLGVLHASWTDLLVESIAQLGMKDVAFRKALPGGFAQEGFDRAGARAHFRSLIDKVIEHVNFDEALDYFASDLVSTRHPLIEGQMQQVMKLDGLTVDSLVGTRPSLLFQFAEDEERVTVSCCGRDTSLPSYAAPTLRHMLSTESIRVGDLAGDLDDAGKLVLVRKLILEGLVRFV